MSSMSAPKKPKSNQSPMETAAQKRPMKQPSSSCEGDECPTNASPRKHMAEEKAMMPQHMTTKITVKFNCGFQNNLYLRGEGLHDLTWNKGQLMKCTKSDEWVWETHQPFNKKVQFKILINDKQYESGENHIVECGKSVSFSPKF